MANSDLQLIAPERRRHWEPMLDLIAKVFSHSGYFNFLDHCRQGYIAHSHYDWQASRIGLLDGRIVSHFGVWDYQMRVGAARLRVGGIGVVATHGELRKQGLMARTAMASVEAMRQLGYDMSILFGIDDFYYRFGYVRAWSDSFWYVPMSELPQEPPAGQVSRFALKVRDDLIQLFNRQNAAITGSAVRPTYPKGFYPFKKEQQGYLWKDGRGRVAGYVVVARSGSRVDCSEACGDSEQVLRVLGSLGRKWGCQEVRFETLPYESELCQRVRRGTCRCETHFRRRGAAMIRTINLPAALGKMSGELSRRLKRSHLSDWRGNLAISDGEDAAMLAIDRARVTLVPPGKTAHAIRGDSHVAQLLIGTDEPQETIAAAGMRLQGDAAELAEVLFPNQHPQLQLADRY